MSPESSSRSVVRGTSIVGSLTLLSRLLGFIRDMLVARLFGSGLFADAFFVAFRIPNLLRSFVAEGALVSAFVPIFTSELKRGSEEAQRTFSSVTGLLIVTTAVLSVLGIVFAPEIVSFFAPGFARNTEKFALCVLLTRIMLPYIMFVSLIALLNGALNSVQIFGASALAQVVMNLVLIAGAWVAAFMESRPAVIALSISVLVGGLAQLAAQVPALKRSGFSLRPSSRLWTPATRQLLKLMAPAVVGATVYQLSIFLNTVMASFLEEGSVSWLFYADRLTQLPIGIFSIALASVLLPALSQAHVNQNKALFSKNLIDALRYTSFFIIPVSCGIFILAKPLIEVLFQRGAFDINSTWQTSFAVQAYAVGLWGVSCHSMIVRSFIAQKDTLTSTLTGILSLVLTLVLSLLFVGRLQPHEGTIYSVLSSIQEPLTTHLFSLDLRHMGLALAASISVTFVFALLAWILHRRLTGLNWEPFIRATLKSCIASAAMYLVVDQLILLVTPAWLLLLIAIPAGAAVFIVVSALLKNSELQETFTTISRYVRKRRA